MSPLLYQTELPRYTIYATFGADGGTRTLKLWILSPLPIPIRLHPLFFLCS